MSALPISQVNKSDTGRTDSSASGRPRVLILAVKDLGGNTRITRQASILSNSGYEVTAVVLAAPTPGMRQFGPDVNYLEVKPRVFADRFATWAREHRMPQPEP